MPNGLITTTALVLTYNQEDCIEEAIRSVVGQTLQPDEILVSDDCSTDATYERAQNVIHELVSSGVFKGSVRLNKNKENLGFIPHFNWAVQACSGELILYNAGDDTSMPDRLETFLKAYEQQSSPKYFLGHSSVQIKGGPQDGGIWVPPIEQAKFPIERLANSSALHIGAAQCFTKSLFNDFGPIRFNDAYEDLVLGFRALLTDAYWYSPRPLVTYRVGGLTFWQKNTWEIKRRRYEAVLSQRSLDALKWGRADLKHEIFLAYQDYGFTALPHPHRITVYSVENTQQSLFDYSIEDHFHRLPQVVLSRPLDTFFNEHVEVQNAFDKEHTLVFLRVSLLGWATVLKILERLRNIDVRLTIDCGIDPQVGNALAEQPQGVKRLQALMVAHPNYSITSACSRIGQLLTEWFGQAFVQSPFLVDIDGPSVLRPLPRVPDPIKVLLVCDTTVDNSTAPLTEMFEDIKAEHPHQRLELYIPQTMVEALQGSLARLPEGTAESYVLKDCRIDQLVAFSFIVWTAAQLSANSPLPTLLIHLEALAAKYMIQPVVTKRQQIGKHKSNQGGSEETRTTLYFNQSLQKGIDSLILVLRASMRKNFFSLLHPL